MVDLAERRINLIGFNGPANTIIDGAGQSRCIFMDNNTMPAVLISGFTIMDGYSEIGAGVYSHSIMNTVSNSVIVNNYSTSQSSTHGGAVYNAVVVDSIIRDNIALLGRGGGLSRSDAYNCLIIGNSSKREGGGMYNSYAYNCTFVDNISSITDQNTAGGSGEGIYNSIIAFQDTSPVADYYGDFTIQFSRSPFVEHGALGNITSPPQFVDSANGNYRLALDSPCIDAGLKYLGTTDTDKDGNPRIVNGTVDMGAYEFQTEESAVNLPLRAVLESSPDLQTWTNSGKSVEWLVPADGSNGFYRARLEI